MQGVDVLCEKHETSIFYIYAIATQNFYYYVYIENPIKILICAWLFALISSIIRITERYMHRKEGLYTVKQLFRIS